MTFSWHKLVCCLTRKKLRCNNSLRTFVCFFIKISHCKKSSVLGPGKPKHYIFGNQFYLKNARKLGFHVFLIFALKSIWYHSFTYVDWIFKKLFFLIMGSWERKLKWNKTHNSLWIWSCSSKIMISNVFQHENWVMHRISAFQQFSNEINRRKYSAWVPMDSFYAYVV